jgi:hypothetical protein
MNGDEIVALLGLTSDDTRAKAFLSACGINKEPKLKRGELDTNLGNVNMGIEIAFRDERHLDVKSREYEDGALVLWNVAMYGDDPKYQRFPWDLPHGLHFSDGRKEVEANLGKPAVINKDTRSGRWDLKSHCVFVDFDSKYKEILNLAVQLPVA